MVVKRVVVLGGRVRLGEYVKKRKFVTKTFFQKMLNEILNFFLKMISADIKYFSEKIFLSQIFLF